MRNLNLDGQAGPHQKPAGSAHVSTPASSSPGISAELAAEMVAGSSLLQHFPGFADAAHLRRWSDPTAAVAAAAAANYMGIGSSAFASVYNQAAFRDLASSARGPTSAGLDYLASFPPPMPGDEEDLNEESIDGDFDREEDRRETSPMIGGDNHQQQQQRAMTNVVSGDNEEENQKEENGLRD